MSNLSGTKIVVITGGCGFVGRHLASLLKSESCCLHLLDKTGLTQEEESADAGRTFFHRVDLTAPPGLARILAEIRPDEIYHLAGMANVKHSWEGESLTYLINVIGAVNLLTAVRDSGIDSNVLIVGSGEVYGDLPGHLQPINETQPINPRSPYSASKACQEIAAMQLSYHVPGKVVFVRPFNHIGPGQLPGFVTADFARQVARIERGEQEPVIRVGNLTAIRDFTDVRDTVRAYTLALRNGRTREIFNVCSSNRITVQSILDRFLSESHIPINVFVDPDRFRPLDIPLLCGSYQKLHDRTQWTPRIQIHETLLEVLHHWRGRPGE